MFKNFNNLFAIFLILVIVALWVLQGTGVMAAMEQISGATIAAFTLIVQYYFRKQPPAGGNS